MQILDGKSLAESWTIRLKNEFNWLREKIGRKPKLALVQVGDNEASTKFIKYKMKKAEELGVEAVHFHFPVDVRQREVLKKMDDINEQFDGIVVQLPLPASLSAQVILDSVRAEKDIDGLTTRNAFNFYNNTKDFCYTPATALAIFSLMDAYNVEMDERHKIAVIGRSNLVGRPTAHLLKRRGCSVSTYNKNSGIKGVENADIIIVAAGDPLMLKDIHVKEGVTIIDVGATWVLKNGKRVLLGDCDIDCMREKVKALAPVPGGVGPMTVVCLFQNLAYSIRHNFQL